MAKVYFRLNLEKDIWNWWQACNSSFMGFNWVNACPKQIRNKIVGKKKYEAREFLKPYLEKKYKSDKEIRLFKQDCQNFWRTIEPEFFIRLERVMNKPICNKNFVCYYTSFPRAPYDEKYKWLQMCFTHWYPKTEDNIKSFCCGIAHELLHFQFHKYYWKFCLREGLNNNQVEHLKEALTFLLNVEFRDLFKIKDFGYPIHKKLRRDLEKLWGRSKDFKSFLKKACRLVKTKYDNLT